MFFKVIRYSFIGVFLGGIFAVIQGCTIREAALFFLVLFGLGLASNEGTSSLSFVIDENLTPSTSFIAPYDGEERQVAAIKDPDNTGSLFVENELIVITSEDKINEFLARWNGTILDSFSLGGSGSQPSMEQYLVRIDTSLVEEHLPEEAFQTLNQSFEGQYRVSSTNGLETLVAAALETSNGTSAGINLVADPETFKDRETKEDPKLPEHVENPFSSLQLMSGSRLDIGVTEAWVQLESHGKLQNKVKVAVVDICMEANEDFPPTLDPIGDFKETVDEDRVCGEGQLENDKIPWHGAHVVMAGFATPENGWGYVGPGGPVVELLPVVLRDKTVYEAANAMNELSSQAVDIVNYSFGWNASDILKELIIITHIESIRDSEILFFTSAGNDGKNLDSNPMSPCNVHGIICVGGLEVGSAIRHEDSNYGDDVDIYAPFELWTGPDPTLPTTFPKPGTSFSSPYVAGVAALVWAADPTLSADRVEEILMTTAHIRAEPARRQVNACAAVMEVLEPLNAPICPPADLRAVSVSNNQIDLSWLDNAPTYEEGFKVERKLANGNYQEIAIVAPSEPVAAIGVGTPRASYIDKDLSANTEYCYRVKAFNSSGNSIYANIACSTTNQAEVFEITGGTFNQELSGITGTVFAFDPTNPAGFAQEVTISGPEGWNENNAYTCTLNQPPGMSSNYSLCFDNALTKNTPPHDGLYTAQASIVGETVNSSFSIDASSGISVPEIDSVDFTQEEVTVQWQSSPQARSYIVQLAPIPFDSSEVEIMVVPGSESSFTFLNLNLQMGLQYEVALFALSHDVSTGQPFSNTQLNVAVRSELITVEESSQENWVATYGTEFHVSASGIEQTDDGGFIVVGTFEIQRYFDTDIWLLKLDRSGNIQWQKRYGGPSFDSVGPGGNPVQQTNDGGYVIIGRTWHFGPGTYDIWVIKTSPTGEIEWEKTYGTTALERARSIRQTTDGGYILSGESQGFRDGKEDVLILKLDSHGNIEWERRFGTDSKEKAGFVLQSSDGGYAFIGEKAGDVWLMKLGANGSVVWDKQFGGDGIDSGSIGSIQETTDGGFVLGAHTNSFGQDEQAYLVVRTDSNGALIWSTVMSSSTGDVSDIHSIMELPSGEFLSAGAVRSAYRAPWLPASDWDIMLAKLSSNGEILWERRIGGLNHDGANSIAATTDGGFVVAGATRSFGAEYGDTLVMIMPANGELDMSCNTAGLFTENMSMTSFQTSSSATPATTEAFDTSITVSSSLAVVQNTNVSRTLICPLD